MSAAEILERIRQLPPSERDEVVARIREEFDSFDDELTPEQIAELDRRAEEFRKDPESGIPWEQVRDKVHKQYGWK